MAVQQFISEPTVAALLCLNDREGIIGEKDLRELPPHRRLVDKKTWGKWAKSFVVRTSCGCIQENGALHNHLVIMRDMRSPDNTSCGIHYSQGGKYFLAMDVAQWNIFVASKAPKVLVNGFKVFGPILQVHDWQSDGVFMGHFHLGLRQ